MATLSFPRFSLAGNIPTLAPSPLKRSALLSPMPSSSSAQLRLADELLQAGRWRRGLSTCVLHERFVAGSPVAELVVPRSVPVRVAHELLQAGHRYLDVRTVDEFNTGHPVGAINIPYMFKVGSGMAKNPNFLEEVCAVFGIDDEIIIGCQSGKKSLLAATDLSCAGFTGITDIAGGYSAWVQNGLPIEE